jgi:hypothetical protein
MKSTNKKKMIKRLVKELNTGVLGVYSGFQFCESGKDVIIKGARYGTIGKKKR